jgi:fructoselysine-6-P-deglycase FrlB-like protein
VNELMLREMLAQPADLAAALVDLRRQVGRIGIRRPDRVVLTGSGDSGLAAAAVELAFTSYLARPTWAMTSASAARYGAGRLDGLTVVISVSGEVRRTIEAAMAARNAGGRVIAVTAGESSTLVGLANATVLMPEPLSRATPHTRDYTLTLLALLVLLEALAETRIPELDEWPSQVAETLPRSMTWAEEVSTQHSAADGPVWFLGMGPDRATAAYGALKFWEAGGSPAWWDDLEEFGHGSQLIARPPELAVIFANGPAQSRAEEVGRGLERMGLPSALIGEGVSPQQAGFDLPPIRPELSPLLTSLPPQALAYAFATRRGIDVGLPLGGDPLGELYEDVHRDWMRLSRIEPSGPPLRS